MPLADSSDARALMALFRGWFGPPRVRLAARTIDGRKRELAWAQLGMAGEPPTVIARDAIEGARYLVACEHFERALDMLPKYVAIDSSLAGLLLLDRERVMPLVHLARRTGRKRRRRPPRARADVVLALRELYCRALEGEPITPEDLKDALGDWL